MKAFSYVLLVAFLSVLCGCAAEQGGESGPMASVEAKAPVSVQDLTKRPEITKYASPEYPKEAKGVEGKTIVKLVIDENGAVSDAAVEVSSGNDLLDKAAVKAASDFEFSPGEVDGKAVKVTMMLPFKFQTE